MNGTTTRARQDELQELSELVQLVLQGAEANQRPDLVRRLTRAANLTAAQGANATDSASVASTLVQALQSLEIDLRTRRAALRDPARIARLVAEMRHAEGQLRRFQERSGEWPRALNDALASAGADIEFEARARLRSLLAEGTAAIESRARAEGEAGPWLSRRLEAEAETCCRALRSVGDEVGRGLARSLELSGPPQPLELASLSSTELAAQPGLRLARPTRPPLSGRLLGVVMPTYGGTMMALVLPRLFNLQLATWLVAVSAVVGAFTMGGAALAAERQRQVSRRHAEIVAAMRTVVDVFQMALSKQIRDGVRSLEQELYGCLADAVELKVRLLSAEATAARRAAEATRHTEKDLADIDADLSSVNALRNRALRLIGRADRPAVEAA